MAVAASIALAVEGKATRAAAKKIHCVRKSRFEKCGTRSFEWEAPMVVVASISAC